MTEEDEGEGEGERKKLEGQRKVGSTAMNRLQMLNSSW